jgi:hypothetical protein
MLAEYPFHFDRIDVFASRNEHVLLSARDIEVPFVIKSNEIASVEPSVNDGFLRWPCRFSSIPGVQTGPRRSSSPISSACNIISVVIDDSGFNVKVRKSYRTDLSNGILLVERKDVGPKLGQVQILGGWERLFFAMFE